MQFIKNKLSLIVSVIIILVGISVALVTLFIDDINNKVQEETYEEKFPLLHELDFGKNFKGTVKPIDNGWSLYKNEVLGFRIEYPSRRIPRESFYDSSNPLFGVSYDVDLSRGEFEVIDVYITSSRFSTINEWIINNPEYKKPNYVFVRRKISGLNAITKYYVPEFPPITDDQILRTTYIIKDNILYFVTTRDLPSKEYEQILNSFEFVH